VIDPDMTDELRVTVVATGLGAKKAVAKSKPVELVRTGTDNMPFILAEEDGVQGQGGGVSKQMEKDNLDEPAIFRKQTEIDYLDIPAFLRNQAD
jgi:cell division protein FtsZ